MIQGSATSIDTAGERRFAYSFIIFAAAVSVEALVVLPVPVVVVAVVVVVVVVVAAAVNSSFALDQTIELSVNDLLVASSNS